MGLSRAKSTASINQPLSRPSYRQPQRNPITSFRRVTAEDVKWARISWIIAGGKLRSTRSAPRRPTIRRCGRFSIGCATCGSAPRIETRCSKRSRITWQCLQLLRTLRRAHGIRARHPCGSLHIDIGRLEGSSFMPNEIVPRTKRRRTPRRQPRQPQCHA